ncbi:MAG: 1-acyl-sn-glycerol-3-phosphate acyltransferase [Deltaproteobacteria bacterium]|nr:1-acyl-sn-glycerol-3-phosphate acyltransferase [Deltaproteobacteria bacterium]
MTGNRKPKILINWWIAILEIILVRYVRVSDQWLETVRATASQGAIVYILRNRNLIDFLCLRGICKRYSLPPVGFVSGLPLLSFMPLWKIVLSIFVSKGKNRQLKRWIQTLQSGGSGVVFLRRPALRNALGNRPTEVDGIELAVRAQAALSTPVIAMPTVFLWGEAPMKRIRSNWSYLFGTAEYPRLLRSIWLLMRRRSVHELISEQPINIALLKKTRGEDEKRLQGIIRAKIGRIIESIRTRKLGSFKKASARVKYEVVHSRRLHRELERVIDEQQIPEEEISSRTQEIIEKLATDFRPGVLAGFAMVMMFVWKKIYSGLEIPKEDLDRIRDAVGKGPLLLIPCHRSHIDYLAISETMNSANIMLPHIAAGDNLAFWPMEFFFRSCGAFFIRRKFVNDKFYRAVVNAYIRKLIQEKYAIEVFIEGGRSRTGKMLRPMLGMLEMALNASADLPGRNPGVLPVFIGYDKVIEEDAYVRESTGKKKKSENVFGLLKSARVLTRNYGKLYVRCGRFFTVRDLLVERGYDLSQLTDSSIRRKIAQEIGRKTLLEINQNAVVTLNSVMATSLLSWTEQRVPVDALHRRCTRALEILDHMGVSLSEDARNALVESKSNDMAVFNRTLTQFCRDKRIQHCGNRHVKDIEIRTSARMGLDYYKNNAIHYWIPASLLAPQIASSQDGCTFSQLHATICLISPLYKWEFLLPDQKTCTDQEYEQLTHNGLQFLESSGIICRRAERYHVEKKDDLAFIASILRTIHEIYHCALFVSRQKVLYKDVSNTSLAAQQRFAFELKNGMYAMPEGQNRIILQNAFSAIKDIKLNRPGKDEKPYSEGGIGFKLLQYLENAISISSQPRAF